MIAPLPLQLRHTAFSLLSIAFALESESITPGATINTIVEHIQVRQWRREVAVCDTCLKDKERQPLEVNKLQRMMTNNCINKKRKCKLDKFTVCASFYILPQQSLTTISCYIDK